VFYVFLERRYHTDDGGVVNVVEDGSWWWRIVVGHCMVMSLTIVELIEYLFVVLGSYFEVAVIFGRPVVFMSVSESFLSCIAFWAVGALRCRDR
jgi:hypothetical protein